MDLPKHMKFLSSINKVTSITISEYHQYEEFALDISSLSSHDLCALHIDAHPIGFDNDSIIFNSLLYLHFQWNDKMPV